MPRKNIPKANHVESVVCEELRIGGAEADLLGGAPGLIDFDGPKRRAHDDRRPVEDHRPPLGIDEGLTDVRDRLSRLGRFGR